MATPFFLAVHSDFEDAVNRVSILALVMSIPQTSLALERLALVAAT
ncbi:hypothetical protein [Glutamicibacter sp. AOP5-A2-18]